MSLSDERIEKLIKERNRLKQRIKRYDSGLTPTQRYKYKQMVKELKLTNESYNNICDERDKLKKDVKEFINEFKNYLDCDWRSYSKDTQQVVKDIQNKINKLALKHFGEKLCVVDNLNETGRKK